jgi:hypothetical protein
MSSRLFSPAHNEAVKGYRNEFGSVRAAHSGNRVYLNTDNFATDMELCI